MQTGRKSMFTAAHARDAMMRVLAKHKTVLQTCRESGISETTFAPWRVQALAGMEAALTDKGTRDSWEDLLARLLAKAERTLGQLALENDLLGEASWRLT